jgi:hypothetical protein
LQSIAVLFASSVMAVKTDCHVAKPGQDPEPGAAMIIALGTSATDVPAAAATNLRWSEVQAVHDTLPILWLDYWCDFLGEEIPQRCLPNWD